MPTIGLTGNFGMGKSAVLKMFGKMGAFTYDIDSFVHSILKRPAIIKSIVNALGKSVISKRSLNKKRMAGLIFNDPEKRRALEKIIHPEVLKLLKQAEAKILKKDPKAIIVFEVPLLFEAGYEKHFDKTVVVYTNRKNAIKRLVRKGISKNESFSRMRAQMPISIKLKRSDYSINNNYSLKRTEKRVKRILFDLK
ncbi:MAG TPA: dephospho-CoA kinase [Nitrospirae bacterium]|nr:dephospho-CoA kinase [bacterium BMS3Bbin09]HDO67079.1 dephospho-CoA kinase [Nitrospirota bacterium]HEW81253.1 dephospho-CoA kinase [Nitrospirota bacterium]